MIAKPDQRNRLMQKLKAETCIRRKNGNRECAERTKRLIRKGGTLFWGLRRVGHRRVTLSHVSCAPSSNWTCGFPASSSPIIFVRRLAPQSFQMAHFTYHLIQPTSVMKEVIPPSFLGSPPGALLLTPKPQLQFAPNGPVHLMECPIAVANPEIGAPPIQDRVQLLDHHADLPIGRKRSHCFANPLTDIAARPFARPHQ